METRPLQPLPERCAPAPALEAEGGWGEGWAPPTAASRRCHRDGGCAGGGEAVVAGLRGCAGPGGKGRRMRVVGVWGPPGRGGLSLMGVSGGRFRWGSLSGAFLFGGGGGV